MGYTPSKNQRLGVASSSSCVVDSQSQQRNEKLAKRIGDVALKHAKHFEKNTSLKRYHSVQQLTWDDLQVGEMLGQGGFSDVHEVKVIQHQRPQRKSWLVDDSDHYSTDSSCESKSDYTESSFEIISTKNPPSFAIKLVKKPFMDDASKAKMFKAGAIDLVLEGRILSSLNHENIIKLHATPSGCISKSFLGDNGGYFLVLDKLDRTVHDCFDQWQVEDMKALARTFRPSFVKGRPALMTGGTGRLSEHRRLQLGRMKDVVLPVARAMKYLHSKNIVFRDLQPSNIGFDSNGTVKLFDFGLAREVIDPDRKMTGSTGSLRYMAPEVARREHYGLQVDVYSFGVFLWEMCTLIKPYEGMTRDEFIELVAFGNERPSIDNKCGSTKIQSMIKSSWDDSPDVRPTFDQICVDLQREVDKIPSIGRAQKKTRLYSSDMKQKAKVRTSSAA